MISLRSIWTGVLVWFVLAWSAHAATISFGPTAYVATGDTPADFFCSACSGSIEDFESNSVDSFLSIDNGAILSPNAFSGLMNSVTDSVDGDDGAVDGLGNGGHSWFTGAGEMNDNQVTVAFAMPVKSAGLVFTDGDAAASQVTLEAFDSMGNSLGLIEAGDLADDTYTGETAEDAFLGFQDSEGRITSITLTQNAGLGIEIDHVHWQQICAVPEPTSFALLFATVFGLAGLRRQHRDSSSA